MPRMMTDAGNMGAGSRPTSTASVGGFDLQLPQIPTIQPLNLDFSGLSQIKPYSPPPAPAPGYSTMPYNPPYQGPAIPVGAAPGGANAPSGGFGGAPAPAPAPRPVMSDADWLNSDSTYNDQKNQLNSALTDFLARLTKQRDNFSADYKTSLAGLQRNQDQAGLNLGEDFTSRGLANSGLFGQARNQLNQNFSDQRTAAGNAFSRGMGDFTTQEQDKRSSTNQALNNAKSQSLSRLAASQAF